MRKNQSISQKFTYWLKVVSLGLVLGLGLQFAQAWVAPTVAPPGGNVAGPLTTSVNPQVKTGGLSLGALLLTGKANCDLKTNAAGTVTCGVDATAVGGGDNLGNHIADNNLNMTTHQIYGLAAGNSLSWGSSAGTGNNIYSDGANGNIGIRASGAVHIQNQNGTANTTLYTGYTYSSSTIDAQDYWIRAIGKWASQLGSSFSLNQYNIAQGVAPYGARVQSLGNHKACFISGFYASRENHSCYLEVSGSSWTLKSNIFADDTNSSCSAMCID